MCSFFLFLIELLLSELIFPHRYCSNMGFGSAVVRDSHQRVNFGGSDPRVDGSAHEELASIFK
jgi:hypothetical protein